MEAGPLRFFDAKQVTIRVPKGATMPRVQIGDESTILAAIFRRSFPISNHEHYVSIQDAKGNEVCLLENLDALDPTSKGVLEEQLQRRYFTPVIERIVSLKQEGGMWTWDVETNRGSTRFYVRSWRDSSYEVRPGQFRIQSVDGQRYEIESYEDLDDKSKQFIELLF